jgi:hypothetical protein
MTLLIFEIVSYKTGAFLSPPFKPVRIISITRMESDSDTTDRENYKFICPR